MTDKDRAERHRLHRLLVERGVIAAKKTHPSTSCWAELVRAFNDSHLRAFTPDGGKA